MALHNHKKCLLFLFTIVSFDGQRAVEDDVSARRLAEAAHQGRPGRGAGGLAHQNGPVKVNNLVYCTTTAFVNIGINVMFVVHVRGK